MFATCGEHPTLSCWLISEYLQPPPPLPPPDPAPPTPSVDPTAAYPARCASRLARSSCASVLPAHPTMPILVRHRWLAALSAGSHLAESHRQSSTPHLGAAPELLVPA